MCRTISHVSSYSDILSHLNAIAISQDFYLIYEEWYYELLVIVRCYTFFFKKIYEDCVVSTRSTL